MQNQNNSQPKNVIDLNDAPVYVDARAEIRAYQLLPPAHIDALSDEQCEQYRSEYHNYIEIDCAGYPPSYYDPDDGLQEFNFAEIVPTRKYNRLQLCENDVYELNRIDMRVYYDVVYGYLDGFIPLRMFPPQKQAHKWIEADDQHQAVRSMSQYARICQSLQAHGCYCIPGTVAGRGQASAEDVTQTQVLLCDIDEGDIAAKYRYLRDHVGLPTLVVQSGGVTPEGQAKLHVYWQLTEAIEGDDLTTVAQLREMIALKAGCDNSFKSLHQPIRIPGTIHLKDRHNPASCCMVLYTLKEHELSDLAEAIEAMPYMEGLQPSASVNGTAQPLANGGGMDLSQVQQQKPSITELHSMTIRANGVDGVTRFDALSSVIGSQVRYAYDHRLGIDHVLEYMQFYNQQRISPPWPEQRLNREVRALWAKHVKEHGEPPPRQTEAQQVEPFNLPSYVPRRPTHIIRTEYLVSDAIPMAKLSLVVSSGGIGKSYLMLDMARKIATGSLPRPGTVEQLTPLRALGGEIKQFGRVVYVSAEDDADDMDGRLQAIDPDGKCFDNQNFIRVPLLERKKPFHILGQNTKRQIQISQQFTQLADELCEMKSNLKCVIFDPLSSMSTVELTTNSEAAYLMMSALSRLAKATGAAVVACHHMKKFDKPLTCVTEARDAVRGATGLVDAPRSVFCLWEPAKAREIAETLQVEFSERKIIVGAIVKSNVSLDSTIKTFVRNETTGLLEDWTETYARMCRDNKDPEDDILAALEQSIAGAAEREHPFMRTSRTAGLMARQHELPKILQKIGEPTMLKYVDRLLAEGRIVKCNPATGSKTLQYLDVPEGPFAKGEGVIAAGGSSQK